MFHIGIDIGSVTVKTVVFDSSNNIVYKEYKRHFSDVKKALNVTLDPAFQNTAVVVTNQEGFNWLDTLVDGNGMYILQSDVTNASVRRLFGKYPVHVISNKDLPTAEGKVPMIMGDLEEAVVMFDRQSLSLATSAAAGDAFLTDVTLILATSVN